MAKLAVDRVVERDGRQAPCRTHEIPLGGPVDPAALPRVGGVDDGAYEALARRYGHAAHGVLALASERGWDERRIGLEVELFGEEARAEGIAAALS